MLSTTKNFLTKTDNIFLPLLIFFPIIKIFIDSINLQIGSNAIFLAPYFLKFYLITCVYIFFIFSLKSNHYQKIILIFFFLIFLLLNILKFNQLTSLFLNLTLLLTFSSFFIRWKYFSFTDNRLLKIAIPIMIFLIFFYGFYVGHFLLFGRFEIIYRHVIHIANPNYFSSFLSVIFLLVLRFDYKTYNKIILITVIALIMINLSSRSGSLALFFFSFLSFYFIKKKIICLLIITIISFSTYKSFESRGSFIEDNFSLVKNSRLTQFINSMQGYEYLNQFIEVKKENKYEEKKNKEDKKLNKNEKSYGDITLIYNTNFFGYGFGISTNFYYNIYYFSHNLNLKITNKIKGWLIYPKHTSYNTLSNLYINGGFLGIFIFSFILLSNLNFKSLLKHDLKLQIYFFYLIIFISTIIIGASFPILENFPTFILLILFVTNISRKYGIHSYD